MHARINSFARRNWWKLFQAISIYSYSTLKCLIFLQLAYLFFLEFPCSVAVVNVQQFSIERRH